MARTRGRNMLQSSNSQTNQTYSSNYPGLNEASYRKMESAVDQMGLSGQQKTQAMNNYYQSNAKYLLNDQLLDERDNYINQEAYQAAQLQNTDANAQLRMTQASQRAKRQWNLRADANDLDVFSSIVESLGSDGMNLAGQYLSGENNELLFAAGLREKEVAPEAPESSVGGIQSIINKQSEIESNTPAGKVWNAMDWINIVGKTTQGIDNLVQRIPVLDGQSQVQNLVNKMNNLTDDEIGGLYNRYARMIENGTSDKWKNDDRNVAELMWDGLIHGDQDALDRVNTLRIADYSEALKQDGVDRNQWGDKLENWIDPNNQIENINEEDLNLVQKVGKKTFDYGTNLLNFIGGSWGGLENYADALGVATVEGKDLLKGNYFVPQKGQLENDEDAFKAYVANQTANFGEYLMDAPDTLLGQRVSPNVGKMLVNTPGSFLKTLSSKVRGATNPLDSKVGLLKMLFTDEGQQAMVNRYGTIDNIANTMNTDPVGLASDMVDRADKINRAANKISGGSIARQNIGDVTDVMSRDITNKINVGLNKTSDWLNNKGNYKTAGLVDIATDAAFNPKNLVNDTAREAGMIARDVADAPADIQNRAKERANKKLQNINRMTKKQQETFKKMSGGIDQGEFQNQRGLKNTEDLANYLTKNLDQVDTAMESIQGRFKSPALDAVVDETLSYALDTEDPRAGRMQELYNKNKEGGLEMSEINEVKRYYERTNMFDYLKDTAGSKKARTATNRDTALREWQYKVAEETGLDNLPELNKETQLTKYLLDNATKRQSGIKGNNDISLTDWIVASGGGLDAAGIASLVGKKVYQSNRFQEKLVDVYNYIGGRELIDTPTVDMSKIQQSNVDRAILAQELAKVQNEADFNNRLKKAEYMAGPALPYNENFNGEPTTTIRVTPEGQSIRPGQIAEVESEAPSNYNRGPEVVTETTETQETYNPKTSSLTADDLRARREERGTPGGIIRGRNSGIDEDVSYELGITDEPNKVGYINYEGDWLNKGRDQDVLDTAYAGNRSFNSAMEIQDGINGMLSDTGMIKVKYDNGYMDIDMMYAPVEDQLDSLLRFADEDVKGVTLNIMDPATRSTARIADFDNIVDAVDYVDKYYGGTQINGEEISGVDGIPASTYKGQQVGGFDSRVDDLDKVPGITTDEKNIVQSISKRASQGTPILDAIQEEIDRYQQRIDEDRAEIAKIDKQIAKLRKQDNNANKSKIERLEGSKDYRQGSIERRSELKRVAQKINAKDFGVTGIDNYRSDREKTASEQLAYLEQRYGTDSSQRPDILD